MVKGIWARILEVDLSNQKCRKIELSDKYYEKFIGGRGLAVKLLWDRIGENWEKVDPLSPENPLIFLTGPATGIFPGGRICVMAKSPLTCGMVGSTIGGEFGTELKCAGWDGIIVTGKADSPKYLFIRDEDVEIRDANSIWGLTTRETHIKLMSEVRKTNPEIQKSRPPSILCIGPAGENLVRTACIIHNWFHAAGYGGYGAVMGSKLLKAIVVKGSGPLPEIDNKEEVIKRLNELSKLVFSFPQHTQFKHWGTSYLGYECGFVTSSEPIRNWQEEWHDRTEYGVSEFEKYWVKNYVGCSGCPLTCLKISVIKSGKYKGLVSDNVDYELQAYVGTNLGIFDPEENIYLASIMDDMGLCGIQTGNLMGFLAELYQRGIVTKEELDGLDLRWGNTEAFAELVLKIARREGIGAKVSEGTYRVAIKLSQEKKTDLLKYAIVVKGHGVGAHGNRSGLDFTQDIAYACSVQGGDHTSIAALPSIFGEIDMVLTDSAIYCLFNALMVDIKWKIGFLNAVTGLNLTVDSWIERAKRILTIQRIAILLGGPDVKWQIPRDDDNPPRFYEPLPSGPHKGKYVNREEFEKRKKEYFNDLGWDEYGLPTEDSLRELDLLDLIPFVNKIKEENKLT